jgi:hypothetical protein
MYGWYAWESQTSYQLVCHPKSLTSLRELDYQCVTDWSEADSECCHTAVVNKEWLEVVHRYPSGVGCQFPGTAISDVCDEHSVIAYDSILQVKARRIPGEGERGSGSTRSCEVSWSSSGN